MFWELDENKIYWDYLRIESGPLSTKLKHFMRYLDPVGGRECADVDLARDQTKSFSLKKKRTGAPGYVFRPGIHFFQEIIAERHADPRVENI